MKFKCAQGRTHMQICGGPAPLHLPISMRALISIDNSRFSPPPSFSTCQLGERHDVWIHATRLMRPQAPSPAISERSDLHDHPKTSADLPAAWRAS